MNVIIYEEDNLPNPNREVHYYTHKTTKNVYYRGPVYLGCEYIRGSEIVQEVYPWHLTKVRQ